MTVSSSRRFNKERPCPVCSGSSRDPRGQSTRCYGYLSDDGLYAHCTRAEHAGGIAETPSSNTYAHRLQGECRCGTQHGPGSNIQRSSTNVNRIVVAAFDYQDAAGRLLFQVVRYKPKGFSQRRPNGNGGWIWDLNGIEPVIYRLPELLAADPSQPVFTTEGEKHADILWKLGLVATTFPMGAGKCNLVKDLSALEGRHIVILPDNDPPGRSHGQQVADRVNPVVKSVRVLMLPDLPEKGDIINWLSAGRTGEELMELARKCPEWEPSDTPAQPSDEAVLTITSLESVVKEDVVPVWPKRIFKGKLTIIAGDPGLGKSYATLAIAARVSLGGPWPDGSGDAPLGNVLLVSAEDGLADTVKPRLELLGADMTRIFSLGLTVRKGEAEFSLSLKEHMPQIEQKVHKLQITLLVVDPILALTGKVDTHKSAEVRSVLAPLAAMADRMGCAVLAVMHPNKNSTEGNLLYRISSSLDFAAAARSVMVVGKHPDNQELRVMATVKCNLSAIPQPMLFKFTQEGCFAWEGTTDIDVSQIMATPDREEPSSRVEAKGFLEDILADDAVPAKKVLAEAKECGIAEKTLRRAANEMGVDICRLGQRGHQGGGAWVWRLPPPDKCLDGQTTRPDGDHLNPEHENGSGGHLNNGDLSTKIDEIVKMANPETRDVAILTADPGQQNRVSNAKPEPLEF